MDRMTSPGIKDIEALAARQQFRAALDRLALVRGVVKHNSVYTNNIF